MPVKTVDLPTSGSDGVKQFAISRNRTGAPMIVWLSILEAHLYSCADKGCDMTNEIWKTDAYNKFRDTIENESKGCQSTKQCDWWSDQCAKGENNIPRLDSLMKCNAYKHLQTWAVSVISAANNAKENLHLDDLSKFRLYIEGSNKAQMRLVEERALLEDKHCLECLQKVLVYRLTAFGKYLYRCELHHSLSIYIYIHNLIPITIIIMVTSLDISKECKNRISPC